MIVLGIDPGNTGGLVATDGINVIGQWVMPVVNVGTAKAKNNVLDLDEVEHVLTELFPLDAVAIEWQQSYGQHLAGIGKLMRSFGQLEGLVKALCVRYELPRPSAQGWHSILKGTEGKGKARSIIYAARRFPGLDLMPGARTTKHDGLADAACIAAWLCERMRR